MNPFSGLVMQVIRSQQEKRRAESRPKPVRKKRKVEVRRLSIEEKRLIMDRLLAGETPRLLAKECGVNVETVRRWRREYLAGMAPWK